MRKLTLLAATAMVACLPASAAPARPAIISVSHLAVYSSDMAKSDAFYTTKLGAVKRDDPENAKGVRYYFNPRQFVEVLPLPDGYKGESRMDHAAYNTADAEAMRKFLAASKVKVPGKVIKGKDGSKYFTVSDPEGNHVEFVEMPKTLPDVPVNSLSGHIIHVGMIIRDEKVLDPFYRTLLGFRPYWFGGMTTENPAWISQQVPDGTDWMEYMVVKGPYTHDTAGILNHFALGVANMEKTVTILTDGERLSEKNDGPKIGRDGKWQFNMYDPDGTRAEFMEFHAVTKPCCSPFTASDPNE